MPVAKELYRLPSGDRNTAVGIFISAAAAVAEMILGAIWIATEYAAWKLGYASELGVPLLSLSPSSRMTLRAVGVFVAGLAAMMVLGRRTRAHLAPIVVLLMPIALLGLAPLCAPLAGSLPALRCIRAGRIDRLQLPRPSRLRAQQDRNGEAALGDGWIHDRLPRDKELHG